MTEYDIAIIGMSVKLPGANTLEEYWDIIKSGAETITFFTEKELKDKGIQTHLLKSKNYVKAAPILNNISLFDDKFFNYSPAEVIAMDPQHRLWLECCWFAIEDAGYAVDKYKGSVGVFASAGGNISSYFLEYLRHNPDIIGETGSYPQLGNDKDFLATRVSYKLNLKGPSVTVQSACSSSLVSVHLACQSLLNGECDMVLAGGSTVRVPHYSGYKREEGGILSSDGHCRAFDEKADGVVFGSGVGAVLLKPAKKALEDGDHIYAVIKGTAFNNDGGQKISYTASSIEGQIRVATEALEMAGVSAQDIEYLEAHGTGTYLGDPVEVMALSKTFEKYTPKKGFCAIGSVKSNIGHCEASAGIAGLIKVALCLHNKQLPPTINYTSPNPKIDIKSSPFFVPTQLLEWKSQTTRKAALNSLGMGGTNAFAILEEAPTQERDLVTKFTEQLNVLTITAKTELALREYIHEYIDYLRNSNSDDFDDICYTARNGRSLFAFRLAVIAKNTEEALTKLHEYYAGKKPEGLFVGVAEASISEPLPANILDKEQEEKARLQNICEHYVKGRDFNWSELINECNRKRIVLPKYPFQRKNFWVASSEEAQLVRNKETPRTDLSAFITSYLSTPHGKIFEVELSLEKYPYLEHHKVKDNIIVPMTAHIEMALEAGGVVLKKECILLENVVIQEELTLDETHQRRCQIHIAEPIDGKYGFQIFSCSNPDNEAANPWKLHTSGVFSEFVLQNKANTSVHAFDAHSTTTTLDIEQHYEAFKQVGLSFGPLFRGIDSLKTGNKLIAGEIKSPVSLGIEDTRYYIHPAILDCCLQVLAGLLSKSQQENYLYLPFSIDSFTLLYSPKDPHDRLLSFGKIRELNNSNDFFLADVSIFNSTGSQVAEMKGLSFKRVNQLEAQPLTYDIHWEGQPHLSTELSQPQNEHDGICIIFSDVTGVGEKLKDMMHSHRISAETIYLDHETLDLPKQAEQRYLNREANDNLGTTIRDICRKHNKTIAKVVYACGLNYREINPTTASIENAQEFLCGNLIHIVQTMTGLPECDSAKLSILLPETSLVTTDQQNLSVLPSTLIGFANVIRLEHMDLSCKVIEIEENILIDQLFREIYNNDNVSHVAYVNGGRYLARLRQSPVINNSAHSLSKEGSFIITGGTGELGLTVLEWLLGNGAKNIILLSRSGILKKHDQERIQDLNEHGHKIEVMKVDVSQLSKLRTTFEEIKNHHPAIKGIIHLAGVLDDATIIKHTWKRFWTALAPKIQGGINLHILTQEMKLDFFIMFSSAAGMLGTLGQANYAAGNTFLDGLVRYRKLHKLPALSICWGPWNVGMAAKLNAQNKKRLTSQGFALVNKEQGFKILDDLVSSHDNNVVGAFSLDQKQYVKQFEGYQIPSVFTSISPEFHSVKTTETAHVPSHETTDKILQTSSQEDIKDMVILEISKLLSLNSDDIDDEAPLVEIGLDSLMAVKLRNDLSKIFNKNLPITMFFDYPTLNQVVNFLSAGDK